MEQVDVAEPYESLYRVQRALAGHISYLSACDTNVTVTGYLLYEPILRVFMTRKYEVQCEVSGVDFLEGGERGDHKDRFRGCEGRRAFRVGSQVAEKGDTHARC